MFNPDDENTQCDQDEMDVDEDGAGSAVRRDDVDGVDFVDRNSRDWGWEGDIDVNEGGSDQNDDFVNKKSGRDWGDDNDDILNEGLVERNGQAREGDKSGSEFTRT